jgi:predicted transcriptional regulator
MECVEYLTEKEEELVSLLTGIGTKKNFAKMLVFLARTPEATSRDIERGTDMRQSEVSVTTRYLVNQGWINEQISPTDTRGRPRKKYSLSLPLKRIVAEIERAQKIKAKGELDRIHRMRQYT